MSKVILKSRDLGSLGFYRSVPTNLDNWTALNIEPGGAREKSILRREGASAKYLFKIPKYGSFETTTEIFNSILGVELGIFHTQYFPGVRGGRSGVFCRSFIDEAKAEELWEMKELVIRHSNRPDLSGKMGRHKESLSEHNIENIFMILQAEFASEAIFRSFFEMVGFDALIGHGDRHWSNYGVIVSLNPFKVRFAPVYDTASGYLTEHSEAKCREMLNTYLRDPSWFRPKKPGLCMITLPNDIKANHFDLLEYILEDSNMKRYTPSLRKAFRACSPKLVRAILSRYFDGLENARRLTIESILEMRLRIGNEIFRKHCGE